MNARIRLFKIYKYLDWQKNQIYLFYTFLLAYALLLLFLCNRLVIWEDEAYSLYTTSNSLPKIFSLSYFFEGQPPTYFIILGLWRKIDDGIFFARLLSVVFIFLSALTLDKLSRLLFEKIYTKWVIVLFLLNPFTVWASLEIRAYSLILMLTLIAIYSFYQIYFYNLKKYKIIFVLIGILGVYTQYYFVFFIISLSLILLISKGWKVFFQYCLLSIPIALVFLPNLMIIKEQYEIFQDTQVNYLFYNRIHSIFSTSERFFMNISWLPIGRFGRWIARILLGILFLNSLFKLYKANTLLKNKDLRSILESFIPIIFLLIIFGLIFTVSNLVYDDRYLTIIFPFYCLIYYIYGNYSRVFKNIFYGLISLHLSFFLLGIYAPPFIKSNNPKLIAKFVEQIETNGEPILFHDKNIVLSFKQYYKGVNPLIPLPELVYDYSFFYDDLKDTIELKQLIRNIGNDSKSLLLINGNDFGYISKKNVTNEMIDIYIKNNYDVSIDTTFQGKFDYDFLRLRRLNKKENKLIKSLINHINE